MKNNFQSKSVPRGTRTIWRYLGALFILFTFAIGNVWAATSTNPATKSYGGKTFLDVAATAANARIKNADSTLVYNSTYLLKTLNPAWITGTTATDKSDTKSSFSNLPDYGFLAEGSSSGVNTTNAGGYSYIKITNAKEFVIYVTGTNSIAFLGKGNSNSSNKWIGVKVEEIDSEGNATVVADASSNKNYSNSNAITEATTNTASQALVISPNKYYRATVTSGNSSNCQVWQFRFGKAPAANYTVTYALNGGTGTTPTESAKAAGAKFNLHDGTTGITAPSGKEFDKWKDQDANLYAAGAEFTMPAKNVTLTAQWRDPLPKYTVTYVLNGASGDAPTETDKAAGDAFNLADAPSWVGHAFDGWLCSADGLVKTAGSAYTMTAANTTFTAQWHEVDCKIYSLTGGIGSAEVTADASNAEVTESLLKLASTNARIKLTPGEGTFKAGDVITISGAPGNWSKKFSVYVYAANGSTKLATLTVANAGDLPLLSGTLSGDAEYVYLARIDGTTQNIYSCEVHRSCAEGATAGLSYATASVEKTTGDAAFTNALTNTNSLVIAGYGTSDASVATVNVSNGQVTVVGDGTATITAYSAVQTKAGTLYAAGTATYTVTVASADDDATLSALSVSGLTLSPAFAAATEDYTVTKEYGAADPVVGDVTATPTSGTASAAVVWDSENHKFVITVTAGDNTTKKIYNVTVNEAEAPKSLSRVLFSNGFDAFIDNTNHTIKAYYLAGTSAPTATTITAGAGTAGELSEGKIRVTGADDSYVDYIVTLEAVTPNTTTVAEEAAAGEFAGDEAWVKNGLLIYGNTAGYDSTNKRYTNRRLKKGTDADDDQRVIAGWVRSYFFVGNASKFIMTIAGNKNLDYAIDGGTPVENVNVETLEIALTKGNHMIEIVSHQTSGDCYMSAPKLVELPPTFTVTYMPNGGSGAEYIIDDEATEVAAGTIFTAPASSIFTGWNTQADGNGDAYAAGDAVTENLTLHAQWQSYFTITYMDGVTELDTEDVLDGEAPVGIADPAKIGYDFAGWTLSGSDEVIDITTLTASTTVYAKWTAFDGCVLSYPATSGDAIAVGDEIDMQTGSFGATMVAVSSSETSTLAYDTYGLSFASSGSTSRVKVTLDHDIAIGTKITVTLVANGDKGSNRALDLYNSAVAKKAMLGWTSSDDYAKYDVATFSHVVTADDAMAGTNEFYLYRNNSVYLQCLKVESCGAAIVYHNVTSEVNIAGKGTVTLGASSVREGYTTTATYSDIDPLYEFVSWSVSGAGASVESATANPATITVGTADAVVRLNLQLIPVKFTVNYYDGETPMGTEEVAVNENPTASEIDTDKRHFTFQGWAETDGGSVVALNTITSDVAATINLYAVYAPVACPTEGTVFSMEFDPEKAPTSTVKVAKNGGSLDLADYATLVGGNAVINNTETSDKDAISTGGKFLLTATKEVMKIELDCAIATGDVIRIPDNNQKYILSTKADKTGTYQSQTSSQHEFEATAAWNGVDDLYILYDGSSLNFTKVYVLRPYTISFDLQGHGDAIDAQKLVAGKKVVAPTAPTADGWDFGGWYKEAACTNAWDFDDDVVEGTMSLFAKWTEHVTNDATLKSLKYGNTAIELEEGVYTYAVELAAAVASVPALSAETNAALATKVITNAEAFEAGQATSTVVVTAEDGTTKLTYTVNFSKAAAIALQDVTGDMNWDFSKANDGSAATSGMCNEAVLANVAGIVNNDDFHSDNIMATANKFTSGKLQASMIKFHTTVDGMIKVVFSNTGSKTSDRYLTVNGRKTDKGSRNGTAVTYTGFVYAGDVELGVVEGDGNMLNFTSVDFKATVDYPRTVNPSYLGTLCWTNNAVLGGATLYEFAGKNEYNYLVFDEVEENRLEAGKPYIFMPENGNTEIKVYNTDSEEPLTEDQDPVNNMYGTITGKTLVPGVDDNMYYFSSNHIWAVKDFNESIPVPAYYCYIDYPAVLAAEPAPTTPAPGRRRVTMGVNGKNTPTGIDAINASEQPMKLLINGHIFILRGEKMFDATGRLVK